MAILSALIFHFNPIYSVLSTIIEKRKENGKVIDKIRHGKRKLLNQAGVSEFLCKFFANSINQAFCKYLQENFGTP